MPQVPYAITNGRERMPELPETTVIKFNPDSVAISVPHILENTRYSLSFPERKKTSRHYFDTFDWQAFSSGLTVQSEGRTVSIREISSTRIIASDTLPSNTLCFMAEGFRPGKFPTILSHISPLRAFCRLASFEVVSVKWRVLDHDEKTIGTIIDESISSINDENKGPIFHIITLTPLRGYSQEMATVRKALQGETVESVSESAAGIFQELMRHSGREPGDYSSKITLKLDAEAPVHESALRLLRFTTEVMRRNEEGIRKSIDTEFLHDYRVSLRRARSILAQLKGVFDPRTANHFRKELKELAERTSALRDLDVYLLEQQNFPASLPPVLRGGLMPFFTGITSARQKIHRKLDRYLGSEEYRNLMSEWEAFLSVMQLPDPDKAPAASLATGKSARTSIKKSWNRVKRNGRLVSRETTDPELHELRIDCKKLRYLMEFFASLFPSDRIGPALKQLKQLQENLGEFVDCSVQLEFLHAHLDEASRNGCDTGLAASLGGLMTRLYEKQEEARSTFHASFRTFDSDRTAALFEELLTERTNK
ncbi:CHAD domain-containing protein [Chlorobium phaeovibrioides]|uniref:CHAD domain-containing protein n=2 Tax=Chlorobium phaeovibrioides TaxID=1094 RepID=A0ABW9UN84_CHLPH|nr:CHAD domain-containing protein [Chlorobium phaeovibrioides]